MGKEFKSEAKLNLLEGIGIIIGHGIGAGILSVPFLATQSNWYHYAWIMVVAFIVSVLLHLMIAELSYNNDGAMFVKCLERLFKGKGKKIFTGLAFGILGLSVLANCCAYISTGASAIAGLFETLFGLNLNIWISASIFYVFCALVVFFGMKMVGIAEKYCSIAMAVILFILVIGSFCVDTHYGLTIGVDPKFTSILALFGMISFALSAVMSVPQVVKGFNGDKKKIRISITGGIGVTACLIILLTVLTVTTCPNVTDEGALIDLSESIGGWVGIIGYFFTIFAMATSYWANSLDLRDIISEQTGLGLKTSYLLCTLPCLVLTAFLLLDLVDLAAIAGGVQVFTALGIVVAFGFKRKEVGGSPLIGIFGKLGFQIAVIIFNLLATIGELFVILYF